MTKSKNNKPTSSDTSTDHESELLQGKESWWTFMEAKRQGGMDPVEASSSSLELEDVGRLAQRKRFDALVPFEPHHSHTIRCHGCDAQVPADLSFCVYCGQEPFFRKREREHILVIEEIQGEAVVEEITAVLHASNQELEPQEVQSALKNPPGVFFFVGTEDQAIALVGRLGEIGAKAWVERPGGLGGALVREVGESVLRNGAALTLWLGALVGSFLLAIWLHVGLGVLLFVLSAVALSVYHHNLFLHRYRINILASLEYLTGFDEPMLRDGARRLLLDVEEEDVVHQTLTLCLVSYYAIWRELAATPPSMRAIVEEIREHLHDLMHQIITRCTQHHELSTYARSHDAKRLEKTLEELEGKLAHTTSLTPRQHLMLQEQRDALLKQRKTVEELAQSLGPLAQRLGTLSTTMDVLRGRVVALTIKAKEEGPLGEESRRIEHIMDELDHELQVFEFAYKEVEV